MIPRHGWPNPQRRPQDSPDWGALAGILVCALSAIAVVWATYRAIEITERLLWR